MGGVSYEPRLRRWTAPFLMAPVNAPTVRRSNALLGHRYGEGFRYQERMSLFSGPKGLVAATAVTGALGAFLGSLAIEPLRKRVMARLPQPGEGPTPEERKMGYFVVRYFAEATTDGGEAPLTLVGRCEDRRDPGYGSTAVMLGESALCLANEAYEGEGGVLTPASAMGTPLLVRLQKAGIKWEVREGRDAPAD
jgi:short subunit dehydrogenase-like uncharacterized protein